MKPIILVTLKPEPDPHNFGIGSMMPLFEYFVNQCKK